MELFGKKHTVPLRSGCRTYTTKPSRFSRKRHRHSGDNGLIAGHNCCARSKAKTRPESTSRRFNTVCEPSRSVVRAINGNKIKNKPHRIVRTFDCYILTGTPSENDGRRIVYHSSRSAILSVRKRGRRLRARKNFPTNVDTPDSYFTCVLYPAEILCERCRPRRSCTGRRVLQNKKRSSAEVRPESQ